MATKCPKCQSENPETATFCADCGTRIRGDVPDSPESGTRPQDLTPRSPHISKTMTLETPAEGLSRGILFAGRYEIIEELGTGGMGSVYRAEDTKIRQEVALKLIRPEIASSRRTIERFRNEIKTARMIGHRNVCRMFDLGEEKGAYFITMEYIPGEDMKSFLRRAAPLSPGRAISIGKQICEGLAEAHRLGVVHRDLKPGNIMIDKEGSARIMDFGIARSVAEKGITGTGVMIGTPEYMSPEQAEGKEADQRSDIYSLGVILFEMVTGRLPFEGETALSIAQKHRYEPVSDPRTLNPHVPEDLAALILHCLEKDKETRFQTAAEVLAELEKTEQQIPSMDRVTSTKMPFTSKEITVKFTLKRAIIPTLAVGVVMIAAFFGWRFLFNKEPVAAPKIENSFAVISLKNWTGDSVYDYLCQRSIPALLITKLENSGNFYVATWERMLDVLKQMGKKEVQSIDSELGFEICRREGIKFIVSGSLNKAGDIFMADIKILDADSKSNFKSFQSRGRGEDSILESQIDQLGNDICTSLGIVDDKTLETSPRIADMTTSSIEAYNHYLKGVDYVNEYKNYDAKASLEKAIQIDPSFAPAYRWLAWVLKLFLGENEAAVRALEQAKALSGQVSEKERLYIDAVDAILLGTTDPARISALNELVRKYPKEKEAHWWLGKVLWGLWDLDGAIREFEILLKLDPDYAEAYNSLSILNFQLGKFNDAYEYARKYTSLLPNNANPLDTFGSLYFFWGKLSEAAELFNKAIEKDPDLHGTYWCLSYTRALMEDYQSAMSWVDRLLKRELPGGIHADALVFRGFLKIWQGQIQGSFADFDEAAELYKRVGNKLMTWFTIYCKGIAYFENGDYELSHEYNKAAFDFYMGNEKGQTSFTKGELFYNLAWEELMLGQLLSAKEKLKEIETILPNISDNSTVRHVAGVGLRKKMEYLCKLLREEISIREGNVGFMKNAKPYGADPDYLSDFGNMWSLLQLIDYLNFPPPFVRDIVPRAYIQRGELDKAISAYESLATFNPQSRDRRLIHPLVHYRLAKLYEQTGHKDKAITCYKKFLDLWKDADPGRPEVEDARKRFESLS